MVVDVKLLELLEVKVVDVWDRYINRPSSFTRPPSGYGL